MNKENIKNQLKSIDNFLITRDKINTQIRRRIVEVVGELQKENGAVFLYKKGDNMDDRTLLYIDELGTTSYIVALRVNVGMLQIQTLNNWTEYPPTSMDEIDEDDWFSDIVDGGEIDEYNFSYVLSALIEEK